MNHIKILIVQNDKVETLGLYEQYLKSNFVDHRVIHAYNLRPHESFPSLREYDAFIIGPTPISANDVGKHSFLLKEREYLERIIESNKPCLGICCGAQMIAKHLGAKVKRSPEKEIGVYEVWLTEHGEEDPFFSNFPNKFPVFQWHNDMFEIPKEGQLLVEGDPCPIQAFAWNNVRGLIFHLEITADEAQRWAEAYPEELKDVGKTIQSILEEFNKKQYEIYKLAYILMKNFLKLINR